MRVSIVIPTYNRAPILGRAMDSVLKQKGGGFELIIVDDGSTDQTKELVQTVIARSEATKPDANGENGVGTNKDSFNRPSAGATKQSLSLKIASPRSAGLAMTSQPNRGPAAARNLGILKARGDFIAFLDSDDEWLPGKLKAQLRFFEENPDSLICQTEEIWIRNGRRVNPMKKHKKYGGWIFEKCLPLCIVSPSAVMMRREFFDQVGLFDESFPACEDYELWLRASARFPIGLIEKPYVVKYGGHLPTGQAGTDQRSREFPVMDRFRIRALEKILESGILTPEQISSARGELERKREIVRRGAEKRKQSVIASPNGSAGRPIGVKQSRIEIASSPLRGSSQ